jgi:hypothetical protein
MQNKAYLNTRGRARILTNYFILIYRLGICVVSIVLAHRLFATYKHGATGRYIVPFQQFRSLTGGIADYVVDISQQTADIAIFGTFGMRKDFLTTENILPYAANFFITGFAARFGNFVNWADTVINQKPRLNRYVWDSYFTASSFPELNLQKDLGAVVLHKYFYNALCRVPRIILNAIRIRKDFFFPVSLLSARFETFFILFSLLKIHLFYRNQVSASRLFWDSTFPMHTRQNIVGLGPLPFGYIFRIYGRQHTAMQTWEYRAIHRVFHYYVLMKPYRNKPLNHNG